MQDTVIQGFRLSPVQQRLWSLQSAAPGSVFRCQCALYVEGDLDRPSLERALYRAVERHEILRTAFSLAPGMLWPLQVVQEPRAPRIDEVDLRGVDPRELQSEIDRLLDAGPRRGFDLERGDVLRVSLARIADREHVLILSLPALCADPATLRNLAAEILDGGERAEEPMQYADVAEWQNQLLDSPDSAEGIERWREYWRDRKVSDRLNGRVPLEELRAEGPFEPASVPVPLGEDLSHRIADLLRAWGCPAPAFFLAAWEILLWRTTGQTDVLVGVLLDGRGYEELQTALGPLAAYLPVHGLLDEETRPREVVSRAIEALDEAAGGQDCFSWQHVDGANGASGEPPFFPFCFASEDPWEGSVSGLSLSLARQSGVLDRFHLELVLFHGRPGVFGLELRYDRRRFRREVAELLAERLRAVVESLAVQPEAPVAELGVLGDRELRRVLTELSNAPAAPAGGQIHRLFEEQVRRAPDRLAVVSEGTRLTYAELNARANRLARYLQGWGVGPEVPVAICLPRSADLVTAVLGVLKSGGFWVPLDPTLPAERLRFILRDTGAPVLLSQAGLREDLKEERELRVLDLDAQANEIAAESASDLEEDGLPGALAYAIYTSGSTGRPKGVLVEHGSPINLIAGLERAVLAFSSKADGEPLRASLNAPLAFDASVQQLVLLLAGHTLHVIPDEVRTDGRALLAFLAEHELDLFDCTPSQLRLLLAAGLLEAAGPVPELVLIAGEAIDPAMWESLARSERTAFFNIYGPTECTVDSTACRIERTAERPTIGRPLDNYEVYLLDRGLRPVPLGAPGEICVGGAGLARGYVGRPEITAERFVPHPFVSRPGARLYRTGDLARYGAGGALEFLGRVDHQVKIRGYRIELGEIEAVLARHPWVKEAVVVARPEAPDQAALAAYVLSSPDAPPGLSGLHGELHRFLREALPVYMVPAAFVPLAAFPLTANGKVDRRALPAPERSRPDRAETWVAPRNAIEETLAGIWRDTLRVERVGVEDNFFELGGDSILSIQVISRAALAGLRITARQMFEHQTIARLAAVATAAPGPGSDPDEAAGPIPLTPIQSAFFVQDLPHPEHFNQSVLLQVAREETLSASRLDDALGALLVHHDALRMRFELRPAWRQVSSGPAAGAPLTSIDLSALPEERHREALEHAAGRAQASLDLSAGPLLRAVLFHLGEDRPARLLLAVHHLVVDGVSWRILLEDLETAYRQLSLGEEAVLPPKTTSFGRWAERLAGHAGSPDLEKEAGYWLETLRRSPGRLPRDREDGANDVRSARTVRLALDAGETRALLQEAPRAYRTQINDVLLTALAEAVAGWTGSRRLLVDLEGHGREELFEDLSVARTVGWFTAVYPVLLDLEGIVPSGEALKAVKEQLRAIPERGIGYGLLRFLGTGEPSTALGSLPEAEIIFNYLGQLDAGASRESLLVLASESAGDVRDPGQPRAHLLEIEGRVLGGRLWLHWTYSENRHRRETVEALAQRFLQALRSLVAHCVSRRTPGATPSDFPLARLDQRTLDRLLSGLPGEVEDLYPLSPLQHGMLFHSLDAAAGAYFRQWSFQLHGDLDLDAFQRACQRTVDRHAILRTLFLWEGLREPVQAVLRSAPLEMETHDFRSLAPGERAERLAELRRADRARGFDLGTAPLMRLAFGLLDRETCLVLWSFHHLVLDGWSFPRLVAEVFALYRDLLQGETRERERPRPFRDYIAWLETRDLAAAERFWRRELAGFISATPLAADGEPAGPDEDAEEERPQTLLTPSTTAALQGWARRHQLTLNTVVQGAWALLLSRYSGERDVVFGAVSSGRTTVLPGIESMLGVFINTLPVRADAAPDAPLAGWLRSLQDRQAEAREHESSPLAQVQAWSDVPRGRPLFESLVIFENYPVDDSVQGEGGSLRIREAELPESTNYPLSLVAAPGPRLLLRLAGRKGVFERATLTRRLRHLENVLEGFLEHDGALAGVPVLSEPERHQILREWNDTSDTSGPRELVHETFEARVAETPDAVALRFQGESLSYAELNRRANRIAHHLRRRGIAPGEPVGLSVERSPGLVAGLLGIWKAGGAFVPLEPSYPAERLAFLVEDTGLAVTLTRGDLESPEVAGESEADLPNVAGPESLAYVIHTSGSTGMPKGVEVEHRQLSNLLAVSRRAFGWRRDDAMPCLAAFSFDIFLFEVLNPLLAGGSCLLVPIVPTLDVAALAAQLPELTRLHATPAVMRQIAGEVRRSGASLPGLRTLFVGGEAVPLDLLLRMREAFPAAGIEVLYGPTETTVIVMSWAIAPGEKPSRSLLGRPLGNTAILLCDASGDPVPVGAPGEIWIGGRGVARGYRNREELTRERYPVRGGGRFYRTGDLARYRPSGEIEFLGRTDLQVKIRGFRVEPGEIEAALSGVPGVRESAVVLREDLPGGPGLVAFVVSKEGAPLEASLRRRLPPHMVPARFVSLDALPLTAHGKVDRKALARQPLAPEETAGTAEPRTPVEALLAGIFADVLRRERVGILDDFFALGGHSLAATQAVSRIRSAFRVELPVRALFETPTVAALAASVEALLAGPESAAPPLVRAPRTGELPLSFAQERLWFLDQLEPETAIYNMPMALGLCGALSWPALAAALSALAARHETLRTTFVTVEGRPRLRIAPSLSPEPPVLDLRSLPPGLRDAEVSRRIAQEARRPFDLALGPLLRAYLIRVEDERHLFLLTLHHIVSDGWSMGILVRELGALYEAFRDGRPAALPELPVQYADFAAWQRAWLSGEVLERQLAGWRERLAGAPPLLELPADRPRPAVQRFRAAQVPVHIPEPLARELTALARAHGATPFILLLAAFQVLLSRLSGQEDLTVGTPIANRNREEIEGLIGFFVNTLALRGGLSGDPAFPEWMDRVRETALGAYAHQDLPFEKLVEELRPERSLGHSPLFQVMLVLQNAPVPALALSSIALEPVGPAGREDTTNKFDVTLSLAESPGGFTGSWRYNSDLFDATTAARAVRQFETLLAGIAARPESHLSSFPWLSAGERHQLLVDWNDTAADLPELCLHDLVAAQAARTPEAVAVESEEGSLTYAELARRASRLAGRLAALGVGPEVPVCVAVERSLEMAVALLAVLEAGGAWVPLDPEAPPARSVLLVAEARPRVLLTQSALAPAFGDTGVPRILLDSEDDGAVAPLRRPAPDNLACILYTSGSTGRPKGVLGTHRGLVNRLLWAQRTYPLSADDRVLQKAPLIFDFSIWELFAPLVVGARAVLAAPGGHRDTAYLAHWIADRGVTFAHFVPSLLRVFLEEEGIGEISSLRCVFSGGEALTAEVRERFFARLGATLRNQYGPTEASIDVTHWLCREDDPAGVVPIGRPIWETRLHILDRSQNPLPIGVAGELCVGGIGLARGYLDRPDLTAERFIPDPVSPRPGERLYRTGDRARRLPGGEIEYLGRIDHQVKIRGVRIEPGEIEAVLGACPGVREAVVAVSGEKSRLQLVAYVVAAEGGPDGGELRRFLEARLPLAMVPAAFVLLPALPRTPSGKLDRKALPAPESVGRPERPEAPRTATEELLARVWAEVLRRPDVGVHDNFFELGGDSILSIQVVARAARAGCRVTPRQIFEHQTVAALAAVATVAVVEAEQGPVTGPVPLTPIQRRFLGAEPADPHHFNQSVLLAVRGPVSPGTAARALAALTRHHDALRLRFMPGEAGWTSWNAAPDEAPPGWERIDLSALDAARVAEELTAHAALAQASLDLTRGPLARGVWFDLPGGEARLLLVLHHLVVDGVSWRVLLEDLETACRQLGRGEPVSLPPKTTSFRTWSRRLAEHAASMPLEPEISWWRAESEPGPARLPLDDPEGDDTEAKTRWTGVALTPEETKALLEEAPAAYRTQINDLLLTALALALAEPGGSVTVALEGHGREEIAPDLDLSRTVGWFTTVFPVRLTVPAGGDPEEALLAVKEHLRALPGRGLGYGLLKLLRGELAGLPGPEVSFNYLGQFDQVLAGDSLFAPAPEPTGPPRSPRARRTHRLDVVARVAGGRLRVDWGYSRNVLRPSTVEGLAERFAARLRELIAGCREAVERRVTSYTPSDFPLARLDRSGLDGLLGGEWGIEDVYPLSPLQEGLLFQSLYQPGSGVYVGQILARLEGDLDPAAFAEACRRLVARHPILRTSFHWRDLPRPLQAVHGRVEAGVEILDWRERRIEPLAEARRPDGFDLSRAPLMRWRLLRTGDREHRLLWSHHHIVVDGWSLSALIGELMATYEALRTGKTPELPACRPYRDYVAWLEGRDPAASESYWRRVFAGWSEPTPLPPGRASAAEGSEVWLDAFGAEETAELEAEARRHRLTVNTLAQGAWALLLGRYSGSEDVVFGATVAGRPADLPGVESIVGLFINTLPVRVELGGGTAVLPWLQELQRSQAELREHEQSPLVQVQEWSGAPRGRSLFESILVFENYPQDEALRQSGSSLGVAEVRASDPTHYPLTAVILPGTRLTVRLDYLLSHYDAAAVERLGRHFGNLLRGIAADLRTGGRGRLPELPWLSAEERRQILYEWNPETRAVPDRTVHARVEERAAERPEAGAVVFGAERLSYGELDRRANRLARHLRRLGVGSESRVAIALERSVDVPVAVLAVLKAGAAYVPLDPGYPAERLAFMLEDSRAAALLTQERLLDRLPAFEGPVVALDRGAIDNEAAEPPRAAAAPGSAAYVIYTSGSTGRPKGVVMTHGALANLLAWQEEDPGLREAARTLQFASLSFDVSFQEMFSTWWGGGELHLVSEETRRDPAALLGLLAESRIERLFLPFVALRHLAEAAEAGPLALRDVITAGEQLQVTPAVARWLGRLPGCRLHNHYGPSETHVATAWTLAGDPVLWPVLPPIGRPIASTRVHLLRPDLQPVPAGVAAELWIGGAAPGRGYHERPDLTAERFVPDPWSASPGERLYRTGDLARYLPDGTIEYLGRADHQVKIRGHRIEPGEIEASLAGCARVRQAAVVVRDDLPGGRSLVAWVLPDGEPPTAAALREALKSRLPEPMIPGRFVFADALPLTPSGKVDRRALQAAPLELADEALAAPRTPAEELLAGIFAQVLGRDRVGAEDGFFDLGGHSLTAMQAASRVRATFGVELPLRDLFESPTVRALALRLEALRQRADGGELPPLAPVSRDRDLPLSFAQERLWILDRIEPGSPVYNMPVALGLRGRLDRAALEASLTALVARHETLRTAFGVSGDRPVQRIGPALPVPLPCVDLSALPADRREAIARDLAAGEAARPFDLARGPLLRATALRLEEERHLGLFTLHHIVSDGWSMGVLVREIGELYAAAAQGRRPELAPLPVQYADYAVWQREWLSGEVLDRQLAWWRKALAGAPPVLELPLDRPRPAVRRLRGAQVPAWIPAGLWRRLRALGREHGATPFMVLLAGFQALLARLSGQEDLVVGSPVANRDRIETEGLIGFFVNLLALRGTPDGDLGFTEHLRRTREATLGAYAHQDLPFERLVEELQPERSLSHAPLFQVLFVLQNAPAGALELPGMGLEPVPAEARSAKFDLTLSLTESASGASAAWTYDTDLFDRATIARLAAGFERLLSAAVSSPAAALRDLAILSPAERHQALVEWNDTPASAGPLPPCLHELFELQAARSPEALAAVFGDEELTYRELDRRARRLARYLRRSGAGIGSRVGLAVDRSTDLLTGVLGIWKAGAAYVPLDPAYPRERLALIAEDAGLRWIVSHGVLPRRLPVPEATFVLLDALEADESGEDLPAGAGPETPAYVIYTSGSTGRPKGVVVPHRGLVNLARAQARRFEAGPGARLLQIASPNFDGSVAEIAMALGTGATLVLAPRESLVPGPELLELLRSRKVTTLILPPSALAALPEAPLPELRNLGAAGEACPVELARRWSAGRRFVNAYGPTEATVCVSTALYEGGERLPLGRPLENVRLYLLDRRGDPVPAGAAGEICVGGAGVAQGYLGLPERTAEQFVPDPFAATPGERLYRTGDLARFLPEGELEFLGRIDGQVKLRGFRIEPGEIEAALAAHPSVREAAVVPGAGELVAWVVPAGGEAPTARELRDFLRSRLPDFLVPGRLGLVEALPQTSSGKVDRRTLALLPPPSEGGSAEAAAPETPAEEILSGIFSEVLRRDRTGRDDDFFALGGHSLLATQVASRVRETFGVELPLRTLFEAPTAAGLAGRIETLLRASAEAGAPPLVAGPREGILPLSFAQQRLWVFEQLNPGTVAYNIPTPIRVLGRLDVDALRAAFSALARRHEVLRTSFREIDGSPVQEIAPDGSIEVLQVDLRSLGEEAREEEIRRAVRRSAGAPFDLGRGPLLRVAVLDLAPEESVLLLVLHHIVGDGWSMGILVRELTALYRAFASGEPVRLPDLPVQYADFAVWQQGWLRGPALERLLSWWTLQLSGAPPRLELPFARPRPEAQRFRGSSRRRTASPALTGELRALGRRESATLFMVLLAGFQSLLAIRSGTTDIVVGTDIANRNRAETEGLIGFFINQLALRTDLSGNPAFRELLARVREVTLGAYAHQDLPFERLVDALNVPRDLARFPVFQAKLNLQNAPEVRAAELPGLKLLPIPGETGASQLALNLRATEGPGGLAFTLEYDTDLFEEGAIDRLLDELLALLTAVAARPEARLEELAADLARADRERQAARDREVEGADRQQLRAIKRRSAGERRSPQ